MYQSGRAGDEAKKRKSPAKSRRVGITVTVTICLYTKGYFLGQKIIEVKNCVC